MTFYVLYVKIFLNEFKEVKKKWLKQYQEKKFILKLKKLD
nr:MAG TPA: hypothetical protein [Caudoviricetes sp.]